MINFDDVTKENIKQHNPNWPQISDLPYRILMIRDSGSGKTKSLLNVISQKPDIDEIYLHAKDPFKANYQFLIKKLESTSLKHVNDSKGVINTQMIWMIFIRTLKNTIQITKVKSFLMIWFLLCLVITNLIQ